MCKWSDAGSVTFCPSCPALSYHTVLPPGQGAGCHLHLTVSWGRERETWSHPAPTVWSLGTADFHLLHQEPLKERNQRSVATLPGEGPLKSEEKNCQRISIFTICICPQDENPSNLFCFNISQWALWHVIWFIILFILLICLKLPKLYVIIVLKLQTGQKWVTWRRKLLFASFQSLCPEWATGNIWDQIPPNLYIQYIYVVFKYELILQICRMILLFHYQDPGTNLKETSTFGSMLVQDASESKRLLTLVPWKLPSWCPLFRCPALASLSSPPRLDSLDAYSNNPTSTFSFS